MASLATNHVTESPDEQQRKVRLFVSDLLDASMGSGGLEAWIGEAVFEKFQLDLAGYLAPENEGVLDKIRSIQRQITDFVGGIYLRRSESVLLIKISTREEIDFIRSTPAVQPDRNEALNFSRAVRASGLICPVVSVVYVPVNSNWMTDVHIETYSADEHTPAEAVEKAQLFATNLVTATLTRESARDIQRMPGPSDLANPCDLCVVRRIAASCGISFPQNPSKFSLKAWVGTAAHQKLERRIPEIYPQAQQEISVPITEIPGLGVIKGHIDMDLPQWMTMTDFKTTDLKKLADIKATTVPQSHFGQTMLYMYGLNNNGRPRSYATLAYIPRDSNRKSDIWVASCSYREDVAVGLINRTRNLVERLRAGDVEDITSTGNCFPCDIQPLLKG